MNRSTSNCIVYHIVFSTIVTFVTRKQVQIGGKGEGGMMFFNGYEVMLSPEHF